MNSPRETRFVIGPNASLSVRGAWLFMGLASFATLGSAGFCTWLGFWPVLPFAGLELAAVGAALIVAMRGNRYREVVTFAEERVVIEFGMLGQGARSRVELPRAWTRTWLERSALRHAPTRLLLGSSGQRVEIGGCLTDVEREQLVARFKSVLRAPRVVADQGQEADMTLGER